MSGGVETINTAINESYYGCGGAKVGSLENDWLDPGMNCEQGEKADVVQAAAMPYANTIDMYSLSGDNSRGGEDFRGECRRGTGTGGVDDPDAFPGGACPAEAQCRCHLSYSCDYRSVEIRRKSPRNKDKIHNFPPLNCCHSHCPASHESHRQGLSSSSLLVPPPLSRPSENMTRTLPPTSPSSTTPNLPSTSTLRLTNSEDPVEILNTNFQAKASSSSMTVYDQVRVTTRTQVLNYCQHCFSSSLQDEGKDVHVNRHCDFNNRGGTDHFQNPSPNHTAPATFCTWDYASKLYRFIARFSGRRRRSRGRPMTSLYGNPWGRMTSFLYVIFIVLTGYFNIHFADACSSRSTPKPRPPSPTLRPNITIQTYTCPPEYDTHYCLNGATCFTVKIGESILYNCECAEGYMGQRCEFKDLDGSYLPSKNRAMLEQAGITSSVAIIVVMVIFVCFYLYVHKMSKKSESRRSNGYDEPDSRESRGRRPFSPNTSSPHHSVVVTSSVLCPPAGGVTTRVVEEDIFASPRNANNSQSYFNSSSPPLSCTSISFQAPSQGLTAVSTNTSSSMVNSPTSVGSEGRCYVCFGDAL